VNVWSEIDSGAIQRMGIFPSVVFELHAKDRAKPKSDNLSLFPSPTKIFLHAKSR